MYGVHNLVFRFTSDRYLRLASGIPAQYPLAVWWKGDDDLEYFTLRCRREDQMRQWESTINRLIRETAQRRASDRGLSRLAQQNSTNPRLNPSNTIPPFPLPANSANSRSRAGSVSGPSFMSSAYGLGPQGYPPHDGFDVEADEDDYEDYPPTSAQYGPSGRGTPMGQRRGTGAERDSYADGFPSAASANRPITPRLNSNVSAMSAQSDASFGNGLNGARPPRALRSQFSSTKLRAGYESGGDYRSGIPPTPAPIHNGNPPPLNRSRSASQPSAYVPKSAPPPLPSSQWGTRPATSVGSSKRGSGSSQSTGESSDYSPNSSSPITPYGSSESSLAGVSSIRPSRSQVFEGTMNGNGHAIIAHPVKVKVHFHEDIFVIQVARTTEFEELVEKVGRKIRLCGPRRDDGPLRVKYRDEDGDMVSLGSTEDVQMAFEQYRPGGQVTLFVT